MPSSPAYTPAYFEHLCKVLCRRLPGFSETDFIIQVFNNQWPAYGVEARISHLARVLRRFLPADLSRAADLLVGTARDLSVGGLRPSESVFIPYYLIKYGEARPEVVQSALDAMSPYVNASEAFRVLAGWHTSRLVTVAPAHSHM